MYRVELYGRVRRAVHVEGMSVREASRVFGLHRDTVRKMLRHSVPGTVEWTTASTEAGPLQRSDRPDRGGRPVAPEEAASHGQAHL